MMNETAVLDNDGYNLHIKQFAEHCYLESHV